jgi:hypothetical protein
LRESLGAQCEKGRRRRNDTAAHLPWRIRRVYQLNNLWRELEQAEVLLFVCYRNWDTALILLCGHHGALQRFQGLDRVVKVRDVDAMTRDVCLWTLRGVRGCATRPFTPGRHRTIRCKAHFYTKNTHHCVNLLGNPCNSLSHLLHLGTSRCRFYPRLVAVAWPLSWFRLQRDPWDLLLFGLETRLPSHMAS